MVRGEDGEPRQTRVKTNRKGKVRLGKGGEPIEVSLPNDFEPIANQFPHAMVSWFNTEDQQRLRFSLLPEEVDEFRYRIECPVPAELATEFIDSKPPRRDPGNAECDAWPSGQMCLDPERGEISRIVFYGLKAEDNGCSWDLEQPFVQIQQNVVEKTTRLRFPSRVSSAWSATMP